MTSTDPRKRGGPVKTGDLLIEKVDEGGLKTELDPGVNTAETVKPGDLHVLCEGRDPELDAAMKETDPEKKTLRIVAWFIGKMGPYAGAKKKELLDAAAGWVELGFGMDAISSWVNTAGVTDPQKASMLREVGLEPEEAAVRSSEGAPTSGQLFQAGKLSVDAVLSRAKAEEKKRS